MSEPRPTAPAPAPQRPSLEPLPPLPKWRGGPDGDWPLMPPPPVPAARASDLPTEDLAPGAQAAMLPEVIPLPSLSFAGNEGPTLDLGIPPADASRDEHATTLRSDPQPADERRASRRHRLVGAAVRASIHDATGQVAASRGRVRDISADGGLFIETRAPLPLHAVVRVGMSVSSSQAMRLSGTVIRADEDGMALALRVDEEALAFLNVYVAVAREAKKSGAMEIHVDRMAAAVEDATEIVLSSAWHEVRTRPDDALAHRRFLDACVSAQRLDYATDRLRELKAARPDVPEVERALEQVGRVLGFVALARAPKVEGPPTRTRPFVVLAAIVLTGALTLTVLARVSAHPAAQAPAISKVPR